MADSSDVVAGTNATALQFNNLRKDLVLAKTIRGTETDGSTITVDWSLLTKGKVRDITIAASRTIAFSNTTDDQWIILNIIQGGSGSYTITWPSGIKWDNGSPPTLSTAVGAIDTIIIHCTTAGSAYRGYVGGMGLA